MKHISNEFMLDILSKVQPLQIEIMKTGRSAHVDGHIHEGIWGDTETHICIDVDIFDGTSLVKSFYFNSLDTVEEVEAVLVSLKAYAHSL